MFDADEFNLIEDAYTDRNITLNLEKEYQKNMERKKQSIVITPPLKTTTQNNEKDKKKIFCEFYNHKDQPMGKKEEFRLNWRLSSQGILHEEYVVNKNAFALLEPVEITVIENNIDSGDDADHHYDDDMPADVGLLQDDDNIISDSASLISVQPPTSERESDAGICRHNRDGYRAEKPLHEIQPWNSDTRLQEWEPNDFNNVLEDRPIRRRNTAKVPPELDVNQNKRKQAGRGGFELFTITDILINPKNESSETFGKDSDFSFQAKKILKEKKRRLQQHRLKFKGVLEFEDDAGSDIDNDFVGFDGQDDGELDEPVNEPDIISSQGNQNWNGDCPESYENTAKSCMQVFNKKKREEFGKLTPEMAVRVADWHRKVIPLLDAAEERSSFNMADYGTKILTHFGNRIGTTKKFEEIVANEPQQEVSRYFLSMLLLANQNNVEISNTSTEMLPTDCISLKLLSTVRHHEQLDENMQLTTARQD